MSAHYRPRMMLKLHVPTFGSIQQKDIQSRSNKPITILVRCKKATFERNDHLTADSLSVDVEWTDSGVDPRFLKNATCSFFMADTTESEEIVTDENLRFTGILTRARRSANGNSGFDVSLEFHDYTALFLECKPFPTAGVANFTDTLKQAWNKLCDKTGYYDPALDDVRSSVGMFKDRIEFYGVDGNISLESVVPGRFPKVGAKLQPKEGASSWDVWQYTVGILGLTSFIDRDRCIVTTSTELFDKKRTPVAVWGRNIYEADEMVHAHVANKGIRLVSFEQETGKVLESFYPPPGDQRIKVKRAHARSKHYTPDEIQSAQYETMEYFIVQDQATLDKVAEYAYNEWSRQEIEGSFKTAEMWMPTHADDPGAVHKDTTGWRNMLALRAGTGVRVLIDPLDKQFLKNQIQSEEDRIIYLQDRGYSGDIAYLIVKNLDGYESLNSVFHVYKSIVTFDEHGFNVQVHYRNQIDISGYTKEPIPDAESTDPIKPTPGEFRSSQPRALVDPTESAYSGTPVEIFKNE